MSLRKLIEKFDLEITDYGMDIMRDTEHNVLHKFQPKIIIPISAISNNADFVCCKGKKHIITADNIRCECINWKEWNLLDMEEEVKKLYNCSAWDFAMKWHRYDKKMVSMSFIEMELKKEEE